MFEKWKIKENKNSMLFNNLVKFNPVQYDQGNIKNQHVNINIWLM